MHLCIWCKVYRSGCEWLYLQLSNVNAISLYTFWSRAIGYKLILWPDFQTSKTSCRTSRIRVESWMYQWKVWTYLSIDTKVMTKLYFVQSLYAFSFALVMHRRCYCCCQVMTPEIVKRFEWLFYWIQLCPACCLFNRLCFSSACRAADMSNSENSMQPDIPSHVRAVRLAQKHLRRANRKRQTDWDDLRVLPCELHVTLRYVPQEVIYYLLTIAWRCRGAAPAEWTCVKLIQDVDSCNGQLTLTDFIRICEKADNKKDLLISIRCAFQCILICHALEVRSFIWWY